MAAIRVQVPLVIEMSAEQVERYAAEFGLPYHDGPLRAKDVVDDVRANALNDIQGGTIGQFATVTIKGR